MSPPLPREFHFVFGLRPQTEPLHLVHWLCLESCRLVQQPHAIHLHCRHLPYGAWWERIAPHLTLHRLDGAAAGFAPARYAESDEGRFIAAAGFDYAHEADFWRLAILAEHGGVYADMDTLFVARYPDRWFAHDCVLGEEAPVVDARGMLRPSLCNAVILARPRAAFLTRWIAEAAESFDGTWSNHSCQAAARLWGRHAGELHVLPRAAFYRAPATGAGLAALFAQADDDLRGVHSLHLWAHLWWSTARRDFTAFHAGLVTPQWVRTAEVTYARLARRFLPADAQSMSDHDAAARIREDQRG
jgi:Glycosyltransferase sugar-binding region containing DXD motif